MIMKQLLSRENLLEALKRVEKNKGSHGVDGMPVQNLQEHILQNWLAIRASIEDGTYKPLLSGVSKFRNTMEVSGY